MALEFQLESGRAERNRIRPLGWDAGPTDEAKKSTTKNQPIEAKKNEWKKPKRMRKKNNQTENIPTSQTGGPPTAKFLPGFYRVLLVKSSFSILMFIYYTALLGLIQVCSRFHLVLLVSWSFFYALRGYLVFFTEFRALEWQLWNLHGA